MKPKALLMVVLCLVPFWVLGIEKPTIGIVVGNSVVHIGKKSRLSGGANATPSGKLVSEKDYGALLAMHSSFEPLFKSNFGYFVNISLDSFGVSKQVVPRKEKRKQVDLGTAVDGYSLAVTPIVAYNIGFLKTQNVYFGVGLGLGYLILDGTIYLTEKTGPGACAASTTSDAVKENCEKVDIDVNEPTYSLGWIVGWQGENFGTRIKRVAPQVKTTETAYTVWTLSWDLYYSF